MEEGASNMVIVDVEIPSGYVFAGYNEANFIQRQETRGANAIFYINEVCVCVCGGGVCMWEVGLLCVCVCGCVRTYMYV